MILSKEQIDLIDRYLEQKKLDFVDYKIEVKDHIVCQVRSLMENRNIPFEEAFFQVNKEWKQELSFTKWNWVIDNNREFPKFVFERIKNRFLLYNSLVLLIAFFAVFFPDYLTFFQKNTEKYNEFILPIIFFVNVVLVIGFYAIKRNRIKTSFSYMYGKLFYVSLVFLGILWMLNSFSIGVFIIIWIAGFMMYCYKKHFQFLNKFRLA